MVNQPVLVVMAAGMGSRYGGLKQIDPVGPYNQLIIDYSIYDAKRAGFETVIFVIKQELEQTFRSAIGDRLERKMNVHYAYQTLDDLPNGFAVPQGRRKPWGTCHAILSARNFIQGPFAVINADDYYGPAGFRAIYDYLTTHPDQPDLYEYAMVGYLLGNTVTEHGHVARGVCEEDQGHYLKTVTEHTHIEKDGADARFTEDNGQSWAFLPHDTIVSMNLWGFQRSFLTEAEARFPAFLADAMHTDPCKREYFLPSVVSALIEEGKARVQVLRSHDRWYGVTYKEDKPTVANAIAHMTADGLYPGKLWE